jgi:4-hydroxybutyryl-CoA dehydratase/vinylacetyl-CoA-Delta-isomerase
METTHTPSATARLRSADEYRASLRDGRRVYYRGDRVEDVTSHAVFEHAVAHASLDYQMAHDPRFAELAVIDGYSRYFHVPRSSDDLLARSALIEAATRVGKTLVVLIKEIGTDALFSLLAMRDRLGEPYAGRIEAFYERVRNEDLALCVAQTDFKGDRSLGPSQQPNPDAYLRIVEERPDGIVVRGAKVHTSVSVNANELIVLPTRAMGPDDKDYAVAFAVPLDTPGLTLVASPYLATKDKTEAEHPLSARRKMVETSTLFDDVFVPNDRIFMARQYEHAGELARGFVEFHRFTAISYKLPLVDALVGSALLAARVNGLERAGHVRDKLSWLVSYAETLRALTHHAAARCKIVNGVAIPDTLIVNIAKLQFAQGIHTAFQHVQDIAGGLLVTYPAPEDLEHPEYGAALTRYLEGAGGATGAERLRVMNLISDLTAGEYGGYQAVLAVHAEGSIEAEKLTILMQYDRERAIRYARWLGGLDDDRWPPNPVWGNEAAGVGLS